MTNNNLENKIFIIVLLPLMALMAPFLVFPIELALPYPHIIEEVVKAILVYFLLGIPNKKLALKLTLVIGALFAFSETVFYTFNFFMLTSVAPLIKRLILTAMLHSLTIVIMYLTGRKNRKFLFFGLLLGILIHYIYNLVFL